MRRNKGFWAATLSAVMVMAMLSGCAETEVEPEVTSEVSEESTELSEESTVAEDSATEEVTSEAVTSEAVSEEKIPAAKEPEVGAASDDTDKKSEVSDSSEGSGEALSESSDADSDDSAAEEAQAEEKKPEEKKTKKKKEKAASSGKVEVSRYYTEDCGMDTGYWTITYSDGSVEYVDD